MTAAPFESTVVAVALIPVAFFFVHAYLSGKRKKRFHPVTGNISCHLGPDSFNWLYDVPNFRRSSERVNAAVNPTSQRVLYGGPHSRRHCRNVFRDSCFRSWRLATKKENWKPLAWENSESSFLHLVVRFSVRRNPLHPIVYDLRSLKQIC